MKSRMGEACWKILLLGKGAALPSGSDELQKRQSNVEIECTKRTYRTIEKSDFRIEKGSLNRQETLKKSVQKHIMKSNPIVLLATWRPLESCSEVQVLEKS